VSRTGTTTRDRNRGSGRTVDRRTGAAVTPLPSRRRPRPGRRRRRSLRLAIGLVLVAAAAWVMWAGPLLAVRTVQVDGTRTLPAEQVREAAGVADGTPLLRVDVAAARARVARLPQVASVEVTRGWPSSVVITVAERVPLAVVGEAGHRSLVDAEGVLFDSISGDPPAGVVPIEVAAPGPGDPATRAVLQAVRALPEKVREDVAVATAADPAEISLTLTDGTDVRWGDEGDSGTKASVLGALLDQIASGSLEPAETIDVSAPDAVVLR
jgi:cell division protein FtsQ